MSDWFRITRRVATLPPSATFEPEDLILPTDKRWGAWHNYFRLYDNLEQQFSFSTGTALWNNPRLVVTIGFHVNRRVIVANLNAEIQFYDYDERDKSLCHQSTMKADHEYDTSSMTVGGVGGAKFLVFLRAKEIVVVDLPNSYTRILPVQILRGHLSNVEAVAVLVSGNIVSVSENGQIREWARDGKTWKCVHIRWWLKRHTRLRTHLTTTELVLQPLRDGRFISCVALSKFETVWTQVRTYRPAVSLFVLTTIRNPSRTFVR